MGLYLRCRPWHLYFLYRPSGLARHVFLECPVGLFLLVFLEYLENQYPLLAPLLLESPEFLATLVGQLAPAQC